ncbi:MAG: acyl-CoA dehydrogenase family protein [Gammaproteobacteria bacterium]|nr:acyl-CoA dehydrogenase family protein [Gammaproteobacteria bacterium]
MDFKLDPLIDDYRLRIRDFVAEHILPLENDRANFDAGENIALPVLEAVRAKVKAAGLWALQMPVARGGQGLSMSGIAPCYEEMNRSIFGPVCFNSAAPDDGNMLVLDKVLSERQKDVWLQPIVDGHCQSAFAMTEPHPGGGSDPSMIQTTAEKRGGKWVVHGRKWFTTGGAAARHFILVARTSADRRHGLTAFLYHADQPGWRVTRQIPIMGPEDHGGHCEIIYDGLEIPEENVLIGEGAGLKLTQIRLGPARLTHCMRWTGMAKRALEIAADYISERESFGMKLADHEGVQWMIGGAAMDVDIGRLLTMRAAWLLDQGQIARKEVSMAKVAVSEALHKAVDTALQLCGAKGYSKDLPLEWMYRYARLARLGDGASEIHKMVLSRSLLTERQAFWSWA